MTPVSSTYPRCATSSAIPLTLSCWNVFTVHGPAISVDRVPDLSEGLGHGSAVANLSTGRFGPQGAYANDPAHAGVVAGAQPGHRFPEPGGSRRTRTDNKERQSEFRR